jgi:hypothetical protein
MEQIGGKILAAAALVAALSVAGPVAATAVGPARVGGDGPYSCVLKATKHGSRLTLTYAMRTQVAGRIWHVRMWDNKRLVYSRDRIANAMGRLRARAETKNLRGPDNVVARAQNRTTGQVCKIVLKV